jgi:hypothetical protein
MTCFLCRKRIRANDAIEYHHPIYKSNGGTEVKPTHKQCHRSHHSSKGDFRYWGQMSSITRAWSFNLLNVRTHPAYDFDRAYYLANYAH